MQTESKESIVYTNAVSDKGHEIFEKCKSPFFTSEELSRDIISDFNWTVEGVEDPFRKS